MIFNPDLFNSEPEDEITNNLLDYLKKQHPDILERVAQSASPEIKEIISHNVQGLVGVLPSEGFNIEIRTNRDNLANLLASAMMTGYFLCRMEQRKDLDEKLSDLDSFNTH